VKIEEVDVRYDTFTAWPARFMVRATHLPTGLEATVSREYRDGGPSRARSDAFASLQRLADSVEWATRRMRA
jgi:hypothetical protein